MTERDDTGTKLPAAPYLVAPQQEAIVDGTAVTFRWEPVEGATGYRFEVASDTHFETVVFEQTLTDDTMLVVKDIFPTDESTFFWRIIVINEVGESHGEVIESFISVTPEKAQQLGPSPEAAERHTAVEHPDEEEDLGPLPGLLKGTAVNVAAEVTGAEEFYEAEQELGVQHEGVGAGAILGFILATITVIAMAIVFVFFYAQMVAEETERRAAQEMTYPDLRQAEAAAAGQLNQYGVITEGVYRIPIKRAMDLMVNEAYQQPGGPYSPELSLRPGN